MDTARHLAHGATVNAVYGIVDRFAETMKKPSKKTKAPKKPHKRDRLKRLSGGDIRFTITDSGYCVQAELRGPGDGRDEEICFSRDWPEGPEHNPEAAKAMVQRLLKIAHEGRHRKG